MKVLCIDDKERPNEMHHGWQVKEGEIYNSIGSFFCEEINMNCLQLEEDPKHFTYGWDEDRFIPISDIDETEMVRDYNLQKVKA